MKRSLLNTALICLVACAACSTRSPRLNAPPHGVSDRVVDSQGTFVYMTDNALLADMTVADRHFLPHRALLSTLGELRLRRLVSLMDAYGGTIRFSTNSTDGELTQQRINTVMEFLAQAGVDTTSEVVVQDMPGGRGMDAAEVILIKANEGTYKPKDTTEAGSSALGFGGR